MGPSALERTIYPFLTSSRITKEPLALSSLSSIIAASVSPGKLFVQNIWFCKDGAPARLYSAGRGVISGLTDRYLSQMRWKSSGSYYLLTAIRVKTDSSSVGLLAVSSGLLIGPWETLIRRGIDVQEGVRSNSLLQGHTCWRVGFEF
jgi:hypothetical protein